MGDRRGVFEERVARRARDVRAAKPAAARKDEVDSHPLLGLQRLVGNRAVVAALGQAKLEVGPVDDPLEAQADEVAARVVQTLQSSSDRRSPAGVGGSGPVDEGLARMIQRRPYSPGELSPDGGELETDVEQAVSSARSGGTPLPGALRSKMENAFEADFSAVKLHSGSEASQLNRYMGAKAFTVGGDVFLRDGMPDTAGDGESLLAHELAHTVQQGASAPLAARKVQREEEDEEEEKE